MFESVTFTLIGDLYHVHQRGSRMAFYVACQSGIANVPGIVAGKISDTMGWRWVFYFVAIFMGVAWLACIFFGWETVYHRNDIYNIDTSSHDVSNLYDLFEHQLMRLVQNIGIIQEIKSGVSMQGSKTGVRQENEHELNRIMTSSTTGIGAGREPYLSRLKPFHGTFTDQSLLKITIKPFFVLMNPVVCWSILIVAFSSLWVIAIALCVAQIYSVPPYLLTTTKIGYISAGPTIGGFLGCILAGSISDPIARFLTRKNKGVYEPEFRLPMMILVPITSAIGYFCFGRVVAEGGSPVTGAVLWGIAFVAVQIAAVSTGNYIVDAFRDIAVESFIISMTVKNFLWFGFSCASTFLRSLGSKNMLTKLQIFLMIGLYPRDHKRCLARLAVSRWLSP